MRIDSYRDQIPATVLNQIIDIYIDSFTGPPHYQKWDPRNVKEHVDKLMAGEADAYVVFEEDSQVSSFGFGIPLRKYYNWQELVENGAREKSYYFADLATRKESRGKGYGALLQKKRGEAAKMRGFSTLTVRVRSDNLDVIRLIEKAGFEKVSTYTGTLAGSVMERFIFEKRV